MIGHYLKSAWRSLWKYKNYSLLNISGLAIGIACAGLIFLWMEDEFSWDNHHLNKENLYSVRTNSSYNGNVYTNWSTPRPMAAAMLKEIPGVASACRVSDEPQKALFHTGEKVLYASGRYADPSILHMFTLPFAQGNAKSAFEQLYSIVLTASAAIKFFGDDHNVIGKTVKMDNGRDFIVTGVLHNPPPKSSLQFEWLIPYEVNILERRAKWGSDDSQDWESFGPLTYIQLKPGITSESVNKSLYDFIQKKEPSSVARSFLFPMSDWRLYDEFANGQQTGGGRIAQVRMLSVIAWIILLIACVNFMNLCTANSETRAREVGVRKVIGGTRKTLVTRFMSEAFLMAAMAGIAGVILLVIALPAFNTLVEKQLAFRLSDPGHVFALVAVILTCGLLAGSYPALYLSSFKPVAVLKGLRIKSGSAALVRKGLVVIQFTVSVVFIIATIIVYRQIDHTKNRNLGFNKNNLVEVAMQHDVSDRFVAIKQELLQSGVIENVALADHHILYGGNTDDRFRWEGKSENTSVSIAHRTVSPEFLPVSGLKIIEGQNFYDNILLNASSVIITQSLAKLMGASPVVGKIIRSPRGQQEGQYKNMTVIGVVDDHVYGNVFGSPSPMIFFCGKPAYGHLLYARIKGSVDPATAVDRIQRVIQHHNPAYPFEYKFVDDQFNALFSNETMTSKLAAIFAALAIIISCLGLFGLAAFSTERRTKEIGVRKVLGASVPRIVQLLSKDFLWLVVISCGVAFPVAWWIMHGWLNNYEYRTDMSWWIFVLAAVCALLIAAVTISYQVIKAGTANPVRSLRAE